MTQPQIKIPLWFPACLKSCARQRAEIHVGTKIGPAVAATSEISLTLIHDQFGIQSIDLRMDESLKLLHVATGGAR